MGGRATFAAGNPVAFTYMHTGETIEGIKVLKGINGEHSLPASSHSSQAYIKLDVNGKFKEIRFYDKNHCLTLEIAYHPERNIDPSNRPVLHYHTYNPTFSITKIGDGGRSEAMPLTEEMLKRYKKYFKGVY